MNNTFSNSTYMYVNMPSLQNLFCIQQRWILAIMGFFGFFNAYTLRICLSMAITQMAKTVNHTVKSLDETCPPYVDNSILNVTTVTSMSSISEGSFEWSEYTQGIILSSFYWGYALTHIPGGLLSEKFSPKYVFGLGIFFTAIITVLTPAATIWGGANALITLRFLMGLGEGVIHPAINCLLSQWIPPNERSFTSSFVFSGIRFGILLSGLMSGLIISRSADDWPFIFHLFGAIGIVWFVFWVLLCYDSPKEHPFVRNEEKVYLHEEISQHIHKEAPAFPWKRALTSKAFLAVVIAQLGQDWNTYTVLSDLPKYMQNVLKLPVDLNGYASSMYNLTILIFCTIVAWSSDWAIAHGHLSRTNVRKINTAVSSVGPTAFLLTATYVGCNVAWSVSLVTIGLTLFASSYPGLKVNALDLSPNYSGTLMGISNGAGAFMGIFAPYVVGVLAPNQTISEWTLIFWISLVISIVTATNYLIFAKGEVQDWNDLRPLRDQRKDVDEPEEMDLLASGKLRLRTDKNSSFY